ncbi:DNA-binding MarR family transcriptional regulator [Sphingomonas zeicaulis]|uniref:MarR family winged helix-turn-helix transcriptional regulator n=1 Tax=Sphingomonas zeicaulis TaxID=1632740 RepID=UPI003D237506
MPVQPSAGFQLSWIARMLRTRFDARARIVGLTRAQWTMIVAVRLSEGATQAEIASHLEINSVTAGRIIDRLQAAEWIERRPDPVDRRVNRLYVAAKAAPVLETLTALGAEEEEVSLAGFSAGERDTLMRLLGRITDNLVAAPAPSLPPIDESADEGEQLPAKPLSRVANG